MRAKDSARLSAIRLILAAIKQKEVDERVELADPDVVAILEKMIKQRRESIAQFEKAARTDLADAEKFELGVLSGYLPQQLGEAEIVKEINSVVAETGARGPNAQRLARLPELPRRGANDPGGRRTPLLRAGRGSRPCDPRPARPRDSRRRRLRRRR